MINSNVLKDVKIADVENTNARIKNVRIADIIDANAMKELIKIKTLK